MEYSTHWDDDHILSGYPSNRKMINANAIQSISLDGVNAKVYENEGKFERKIDGKLIEMFYLETSISYSRGFNGVGFDSFYIDKKSLNAILKAIKTVK